MHIPYFPMQNHPISAPPRVQCIHVRGVPAYLISSLLILVTHLRAGFFCWHLGRRQTSLMIAMIAILEWGKISRLITAHLRKRIKLSNRLGVRKHIQ
ncbi:hypothetical protein BX600DRAFT_157206 [Xylariales sp. PMI_506]|nr:hypothetical protein BX600DRAFT_157206 [Xylariales sp. PMI_506]